MKLFMNFMRDEDGAVTVDWVVLTAAIVGLGIAVLTSVSGGTTSLADKISSELAGTTISTYYLVTNYQKIHPRCRQSSLRRFKWANAN